MRISENAYIIDEVPRYSKKAKKELEQRRKIYNVEEKTWKREFDAFTGIPFYDRKVIITNDDMDYSTSAVEHIRLADFLQNTSFSSGNGGDRAGYPGDAHGDADRDS